MTDKELAEIVDKVNLPTLWEDPPQEQGTLIKLLPVIFGIVEIILLVLLYFKK